MGEFNQAIGVHLSSPDFAANEALFLLALLAFNLASFLRLEMEAAGGGCWSLERFRDVVLKTGGRVVKHGRRLVLRIAQAAQPFWDRLSRRLRRWKFPASLPPPSGPQPRAWMPPPPARASHPGASALTRRRSPPARLSPHSTRTPWGKGPCLAPQPPPSSAPHHSHDGKTLKVRE